MLGNASHRHRLKAAIFQQVACRGDDGGLRRSGAFLSIVHILQRGLAGATGEGRSVRGKVSPEPNV